MSILEAFHLDVLPSEASPVYDGDGLIITAAPSYDIPIVCHMVCPRRFQIPLGISNSHLEECAATILVHAAIAMRKIKRYTKVDAEETLNKRDLSLAHVFTQFDHPTIPTQLTIAIGEYSGVRVSTPNGLSGLALYNVRAVVGYEYP